MAYTKRSIWGFLFICSFIFFFSNCLDDGLDPTDDNPPTNTSEIKKPMAFAFIDANPVNRTFVPDVTVTILDTEGQVVTSSGNSFSSINLIRGVMNLGLKRDAIANSGQPYTFYIIAEADGYVPMMETVFLSNENPEYFPVFMAQLEAPPEGITTVITTLPIDQNGVVLESISLQTPFSNQYKEQLTLNIDEGTQLLSNNEPISGGLGEAQVQLAYGNPLGVNVGRVFPNGFLVTNAFDKGDRLASPTSPLIFASAGWITVSMQVGDTKVDGFSDPINASIDINSELLDIETGEPLQAQDVVPIWSLDESTGAWNLEENISLENVNGVLRANFPMIHLSTWNIDKPDSPCGPVDIMVNNPNPTQTFYADIINASTGSPYMLTGVGTTSLNDTEFTNGLQTYGILNSPGNVEMALVVYENSTLLDPPIGLSEVFINCTAPSTQVDLSLLSSNTFCLHLDVQVDGNSDICNNAVWYRPVGTTIWRYAGVLQNGALNTLAIDPTNIYDFQIWYDDNPTDLIDNTINFRVLPNMFTAVTCGTEEMGTMIVGATQVTIRKTCSRISTLTCNDPGVVCNNCPTDGEASLSITIDGVTFPTPPSCI